MTNRNSLTRHQGFTLVELMIVIVIVSVLVSVAVPTYTAQVQKSRRTDARSAIMDLAGREERFYSTSNAYTSLQANLGYAAAGSTAQMTNVLVGGGYYQLTVTVPDPAQNVATAPNSYIITATAVNQEANDAICTSMSLNQIGQQTMTGTGTVATCWGN